MHICGKVNRVCILCCRQLDQEHGSARYVLTGVSCTVCVNMLFVPKIHRFVVNLLFVAIFASHPGTVAHCCIEKYQGFTLAVARLATCFYQKATWLLSVVKEILLVPFL